MDFVADIYQDVRLNILILTNWWRGRIGNVRPERGKRLRAREPQCTHRGRLENTTPSRYRGGARALVSTLAVVAYLNGAVKGSVAYRQLGKL